MPVNLVVRPLQSCDIAEVVVAFLALGWGGKDTAQFERYLAEQDAGMRVTRLRSGWARADDARAAGDLWGVYSGR